MKEVSKHDRSTCTKPIILKRALSTIALASLLVAAVASITGCDLSQPNKNPTDPNPGITTPVDPSTPSNPSTPAGPTASHSDLLYDLLTNSYYRSVVEDHKNDKFIRKSQLYDPIPYGFLEDRGYDINAIKNDTLEADSMPYTKENEPNSLYVATRVETAGETPYYTCYTLKYQLSDLEMADLQFTHEDKTIESPLFIQELSYQKTPKVVAESSIYIQTYNDMVKSFQIDDLIKNTIGTNYVTIDVLGFSEANNTITLSVRPKSTSKFISKVKIATQDFKPGRQGAKIHISNNIYMSPSTITFLSKEDIDNYINNASTITYYDTTTEAVFNYSLYNYIFQNKT